MPGPARHTRSLVSLLAAVLLLAAAPARAQQGKDAKEAAAKEAAAGDKAFSAGDHAGALAHYDAAVALYPTANLQFNRALVLVELKRPADAVVAFETFLDGAKDVQANVRQYAQEQISKLERKVARVTVRAKRPGTQLEVAGAQVILNGKPIGELPAARPFVVAPGDYRLEVTAEGFRSYTVDNITLVAGSPQVIVAQLVPLDLSVKNDPGGRGGPGGPTEHKSVLRKWWFWGIVGTVVVGATVATILIFGAGDGVPDSDLGTVEPQF
jgi:hypothetical protein